MKHILILTSVLTPVLAAFLSTLLSALPLQAREWTETENDFRMIPEAARQMTGPLFWMHGDESQSRLESMVDVVAESGNGILATEPRPHSDWLGEGWFRDVKIVLEQAKKNDLKVIIYDDYWWPSQMMGGRVPPEMGCKRLYAEEFEPSDFRSFDRQNLILAAAAKKVEGGAFDANSLQIASADWKAPDDGDWKILLFWWEFVGPNGSQKREISVDGMDKKCVQWFLDTVYQPHYDRFKDDFGKTIVGFFYDEPETNGDWGSDLADYIAENGLDLKTLLVAYKFQLAGEIQQTAKYSFLNARAESWGRTMYGGMTRWCEEHGVYSSGHFMEHGGDFYSQKLSAGNMMQLGKYTTVPGIDLVCRQLYPGQRTPELYQMPKISSSLAHVYDRHDGLNWCEIFGAYGQDLTYLQMKWLCDWHQSRGCNFLIPHSFNPRAPYDTDCPPYFYNGGEEPRWPLFRIWANYNNRLAAVLSNGTHVAQVAFVTPGESFHCGKTERPEGMTTVLQDAQLDCDWILYDAIENAEIVSKNPLKNSARPAIHLAKEYYEILVLPATEIIPYSVLVKAKEFLDEGGIVIGYKFLPRYCATFGKTSEDVQALTDAIFHSQNPHAHFFENAPTLEELNAAINELGITPDVRVRNGSGFNLNTYRYQKDGADIYFLCSQDWNQPARKWTLEFDDSSDPECWDAMRGTMTRPEFRKLENGKTEVTLTLQSSESAFIIFPPTSRPLPRRIENPLEEPAENVKIIPIFAAQTPETGSKTASETAKTDAEEESDENQPLIHAEWVWHPENPKAQGEIWLKSEFEIQDIESVQDSKFIYTCDNGFELFLNGKSALKQSGDSDEWRTPVQSDLTKFLKTGTNEIRVHCWNRLPGDAGFLGAWRIHRKSDTPLYSFTSGQWLASRDQKTWVPALSLGKFGCGPWGDLGKRSKTVSPIAASSAIPFSGTFELPVLADGERVFFVAKDADTASETESALRIYINGQEAGGFLGAPCQLEITDRVKVGKNTLTTEPFSPVGGTIVIVR